MADVRYAKTHEWCSLADGVVTCGITRHAVDELGDLTFLDFRAEVGQEVKPGETLAEVDSVKATSEIYAPVAGKVTELNERFKDEDELPALSASPEDEGWLFKIEVADAAEHGALMDREAYDAHCAAS